MINLDIYRYRYMYSVWKLRYIEMGNPLLRNDGSVIYSYNYFRASPAQSLLGPSPAELLAIFRSLIWERLPTSNLEVPVPVFISPGKRLAQLYHRTMSPLVVASYGSQKYFGIILNCLHMRNIYDEIISHGPSFSILSMESIENICFNISDILMLIHCSG
jgi:hypothetical protein